MDFEKILEMEANKETMAVYPGKLEIVNRQTQKIVETTPTAIGKFDTRAVMADLKALEIKGTALINQANALKITTAEESTDAVNISGQLQEVSKQVKKKCEDFLEPYKKVTAAINGPKKRIIEAVTKAKNIINQKIFQFKKQEEIDQAKQQNIINEATESLQESLKVQAKELGIKAPTVAPIKAAKPTKVLRGDAGTSLYARKVWTAEISNPKEVPREWCSPDMKKINDSVRMGKRDIPGVKIFEKETVVTRG